MQCLRYSELSFVRLSPSPNCQNKNTCKRHDQLCLGRIKRQTKKLVAQNGRKSAYKPSSQSGWSLSQRLGVFLLSQDYPWVTLSTKFAGTHLYTWVERGTVRVKCFAQEHNTMSPARVRTWTAQSRDNHTNHGATMLWYNRFI